jgi:low affinity Fe/Cu permease
LPFPIRAGICRNRRCLGWIYDVINGFFFPARDMFSRCGARRETTKVKRLLALVRHSPAIVGSPSAFLLAVTSCVVWVVLGPFFDWSDAWLVLPATATSIGAFLLVFLLQYTQNRDTRVLQLKLDELIRGLADARTHLVRLEHVSDEELERIEREFSRIREEEAT